MELLYQEDAYSRSCEAQVVAADDDGIRLDRTVFYPMGGGQPGDVGSLKWTGHELRVIDTRKGEAPAEVLHLPEGGSALPSPGTRILAEIDWPRRHRLMRMHTTLHLLCSLVEGDVTGGQVGTEKSRLDFNLPERGVDKETLEQQLNRLIEADHVVSTEWISEAELAANPGLVRTMSVKPPLGSGRVRLVRIGEIDLQPCGGTHVASTGEIGRVRVGKIESKGKQNRRINVHLLD